MAWDQSQFDAALKKKYELQQQGANTAAQDVAQKPEIQARADAAAMQRAELASQTQQNIAAANEAGASARAAAAQQAQKDIAGLQDTGATNRTQMTTNTQRDIAGMENQLGRDRLNQQGQQFNQTMGLDTAKAQESAIQGRAALQSPEYGAPSFNPRTGAMESAIKRPAITGLAPSPLSTLGGGSGLSMESEDDLKKRRAAAAASMQ